MKTDIEIASEANIMHIKEIANKLNLKEEEIDYYGKYKAKIKAADNPKGKLILVTATNPTPYGEGKTTVSIGLIDALNKLGKKTAGALREPSLGPVFGLKGGATGGGYSQVIPMEDINLHFNGDFHAITSANNLLSSAIDNHIYFGNELNIDENNIKFERCIDLNDRSLREVEITIKKDKKRKDSFNITAASEIMVILCLSKDISDLKRRLGNIIVAYTKDGKAIYAKDLKVEGAMTVLLKDAIKPNLVQTLENNPVIIHGGPFANIAHGCNSIIATKTAMSLGEYAVTEAGFGSDLGAEKFLDIKCRLNGIKPSCIVLVTTIKALKYNAGISKDNLLNKDVESVKIGLSNLQAHIENLKKFNVNIVVCLNKYNTDYDEEIEVVQEYTKSIKAPFSITTSYKDGAEGALDLANKVIDNSKENEINYIYNIEDSIKTKIEKLSKEIYHASNVVYKEEALKEIEKIESLGLSNLPICIAKTQYSISDDKDKLGYPKDYEITVKNIKLYNGAGFITVLLGDILTMPGLPKIPNYEQIDIEGNKVKGLF